MGDPARRPKPTPPLAVFRLAEALAEFRHRVEQVYALAGDPFDPESDDPEEIRRTPVPEVVEKALTAVSRLTEAVPAAIGGRPGLDRVAADVRRAAADALNRLVKGWHTRDHRNRIRDCRGRARTAAGDPVRQSLLMLTGSPVGPDRWGVYELTGRTFEGGLPADYQPLFALGRLLGRAVFPPFEDLVTAGHNDGWDRVARRLGPPVTTALAWAAGVVPRLNGLGGTSAVDTVDGLSCLRTEVARELAGTPDVGLGASPADVVGPAEYARLVGIRATLTGAIATTGHSREDGPVNGGYVGDSVAILRVFEQIAVCREAGLRSVLILGPKGTGKTTLAGIIHRALNPGRAIPTAPGVRNTAAPVGGLFRWQASNSQAADPLGPRSQWVGFAAQSGYANVPAGGKKGLLELCDGGSIFVDEFGDLHPDVQTLLLDVAEGREVVRVGGTPLDAYRPNVCLILATNKDVRAAVRDDLLDRVGVTIRLPPLRDRPEDLFPLVRHHLRGTPFGLSLWTWALLLAHDWPGNVRELERTLDLVRAAHAVRGGSGGTPPKRPRTPEELPHDLFLGASEGLRVAAGRVGDAAGDAAEYRLFVRLKGILEGQGYVAAAHGPGSRPLYTRMAELLGDSKSTVTVRRKDALRGGLRSGFPFP